MITLMMVRIVRAIREEIEKMKIDLIEQINEKTAQIQSLSEENVILKSKINYKKELTIPRPMRGKTR